MGHLLLTALRKAGNGEINLGPSVVSVLHMLQQLKRGRSTVEVLPINASQGQSAQGV